SPYGRYQLFPGRSGEFPPQVAHMYVDDVALGIEVHVPHLLEQRGAPHDFLRMQQEELEELELLGRERDLGVVHLGGMAQPVEGQRTVAQHLEPFRSAAASERSDS